MNGLKNRWGQSATVGLSKIIGGTITYTDCGYALDNKFKHRGSKFNPIWYGPFQIIDQPSPNSFTLELPADCHIHPTFHVSKLKPASDESLSKLKKVALPTDSSKDGIYVLKSVTSFFEGRFGDKAFGEGECHRPKN